MPGTHTTSSEQNGTGTYHCSNCRHGYDNYHECPDGPDRVEFECTDCEDHINRETHHMDVQGLAPQRCADCTLETMAES